MKQQIQASDTYVVRGRVIGKTSCLVKLMTHCYRADKLDVSCGGWRCPSGIWQSGKVSFSAVSAEIDRFFMFGTTEKLAEDLWWLAKGAAQQESRLHDPLVESDPLSDQFVLGRSPAMCQVMEQVRLVAPRDTTVLITGETGTGKERISRAIHLLSRRGRAPMVAVNCGGIPATLLEDEFFGHVKGAFTDAYQARVGRFEQAQGSTIFLDEIGDLPLELQPKLLRALQEKEIHRIGGAEAIQLDLRVIAATNVDLWRRVQEGRFREDLYYRINVFPIHLPPLRERSEDIPLFVRHFLGRFSRGDHAEAKLVLPSVETELVKRPWPGNIRELENAVEIAVIRSQNRREISIVDFPVPRQTIAGERCQSEVRVWTPEIQPGADQFKTLVLKFERDLIFRTLEATRGNKNKAARMLGLKRTTLIEKLKRFEGLAG